jgi:hypothetical protein
MGVCSVNWIADPKKAVVEPTNAAAKKAREAREAKEKKGIARVQTKKKKEEREGESRGEKGSHDGMSHLASCLQPATVSNLHLS